MGNTQNGSSQVIRYLRQIGITGDNMGPHALRATAATSALVAQAFQRPEMKIQHDLITEGQSDRNLSLQWARKESLI